MGKKTFLQSGRLIWYLLMSCSFMSASHLYSQKLKLKNSGPDDAIVYTRKNAASPQALADLKALEKAIGIMKTLPCNSPLSWYYQGGIHSVPDTVLNGNPLCPEYITLRDTLPGWHNCPHFGNAEVHFLIWHRLFIWHFEKIVRKLSGKKDFALPYWDYTNPNNRALPAIFRDSSSPLFEPARMRELNLGKPMEQCLRSSLRAVIPDSMRLYQLFNHSLNMSPHSPIHPAVGGWYCDASRIKNMWNKIYQTNTTGLMWEFQSAAFDPIFWLHHSNIDYLWQRWERSSNGALPITDSLIANPWPYIFFDENDSHKIVYSVEEVVAKINSLDYVYDVLANKTLRAKPRAGRPPVKIGEAAVSKLVDKKNFSFVVRFPTSAVREAHRNISKEKQLTLLELTISYTRQPTGVYELYLENAGVSKLLGFITFLGNHAHEKKGTDHMQEMMHAQDMHEEGGEKERQFHFDLTKKINLASFNGNLNFRLVRQGGRSAEIKIRNMILKTVGL